MSTPRLIHQKIQEISNTHPDGKMPIDVYSIGEQLGITLKAVVEHIAILKTLDLVEYTDNTHRVITLTDSGKMARL